MVRYGSKVPPRTLSKNLRTCCLVGVTLISAVLRDGMQIEQRENDISTHDLAAIGLDEKARFDCCPVSVTWSTGMSWP